MEYSLLGQKLVSLSWLLHCSVSVNRPLQVPKLFSSTVLTRVLCFVPLSPHAFEQGLQVVHLPQTQSTTVIQQKCKYIESKCFYPINITHKYLVHRHNCNDIITYHKDYPGYIIPRLHPVLYSLHLRWQEED